MVRRGELAGSAVARTSRQSARSDDLRSVRSADAASPSDRGDPAAAAPAGGAQPRFGRGGPGTAALRRHGGPRPPHPRPARRWCAPLGRLRSTGPRCATRIAWSSTGSSSRRWLGRRSISRGRCRTTRPWPSPTRAWRPARDPADAGRAPRAGAGRWHGAPQARRVIAFADGRSESVGESFSRIRLARGRAAGCRCCSSRSSMTTAASSAAATSPGPSAGHSASSTAG